MLTLSAEARTELQSTGRRPGSSAPVGKWRILVLTENFAGWERGGDWNDFSFSDNDASIEQMAIVGERKWEELALLFTAKGLRAVSDRILRADADRRGARLARAR